MDEDAQLIGQTIAGRYEVTGLLGAGGMGAVYVAKQMPLGRQVALKVIRPGLITDSQSVERFKREATTVSQLLHPNIVTVYDFGQAERGLLFIAMELLPGENLRQRLRRTGPIPWQTVLGIVRDIAGGLSAAHAQGVIHRDLKPDNVMLIDAGRPDFVKLLDFGVAKLTEHQGGGNLTNTGMLVGTPGYMAPEAVLKGITTDPRSDIYAVGVLFFEMLTGATMFTAPTPVALVMKHATERPPLISDLKPQTPVPMAVENLVQQMIAKEPDDRPPDAKTLVGILEHMMRFGDDLPADPFSTGAYKLVQTTGSVPVAGHSPPPASDDDDEPTQINAHNPLAVDNTEEDTAPSAKTDQNFEPPTAEPVTRTFAGAPVANTPATGSTPRPTIAPTGETSSPEVAVVRSGQDTMDSIRQAGVGSGGGGLVAAALVAVVIALGIAAAAWWFLGRTPPEEVPIAAPTPTDPAPDPAPPVPTEPPPKSAHERCDEGDAAACAEAATAATDPKMALALHKRACDAKLAASCVTAAEATTSEDEKKQLLKRACELGDEARCEAAAVEAKVDDVIEEPPSTERKTRRKRTRRTRKKPAAEEPAVEEPVEKDPGGFVPDLLLDDKPKRKIKKPKPKPKDDGHVPDLMLE
jgi:serine/threonine-protein kinase